MILGFKTQIKRGGKMVPTRFPERILRCKEAIPTEDVLNVLDAGAGYDPGDKPKIHTLRTDAHGQWQCGRTIHFSTGVRTSGMKIFATGNCTGTQHVFMRTDNVFVFVSVDGKQLTGESLVEFYQNDGFDSLEAFCDWFVPVCLDAQAEGKRGVTLRLIHWTDKRY